ncbi:putative flippase GtrA [Pectinatus brassicae]|uniref:Putative flippase GtrA n=2 Tax=Pectinatus brassicae TaxID=862415 RepID=A0A840ULY5_9FIRM|nr:GtrA family protein [Pectinatus brassicae]MBB5336807.1 putative flippase GtrA [Pectinatus brassicae]
MLYSKKFINIYREILSFLLVGGFTFIIDYAGLYVLTEIFNINYLISSGISFTAAVIVNYYLCVRYVFKNTGKIGKKAKVLFLGSSIAGLGLNQVCMYFFVSVVGIYYMIAKLVSTAIVTMWNYIMKKRALKN